MSSRWRAPIKRESIGVTARRTRAQMLAMIHEPAQRERYLADNPEDRLPALPKPRIRRADGKPITASEHQEQKAVIDWWRTAHGVYRLPLFALFSVPNGSYLSSGFYAAASLKSEGMRPGAPDLIIAAPTPAFSGLFLEMKKIGGAKPSDEQTAFIDYLLSAGYSAGVHYGAASAIRAIEDYLAELLPA